MARLKRLNVPGTTTRSKDDDEREEEEEHREREDERAVRPRLDDAAPAAPPAAQPAAMTQAFEAEDQVVVQQHQEQVGQHQQQQQQQELGNMGPPQAVVPAAGGPLQARVANEEEEGDDNNMEVDPAMDVVVALRPLSRSSNTNISSSSSSSSNQPEVARPHSASLLLQPSLPSLPVLSPINDENDENSTNNNMQAEPTTTTAATTTPSSSSSSSFPSSSPTLTSYTVGMFLEVQDQVQKWCEAEVIGINTFTYTLRITYLYWGDKYDEDIPFFSSRLAPFPTHTYQPGEPRTLQVGQRVEKQDGERWGEAEVKALEEKEEEGEEGGREGGRRGMVLVSWKRPKEKERVEEWLPRDSPRLRAYGRMKKATLEKKRLNRSAAAAAVGTAATAATGSSSSSSNGGLKRIPLQLIGGSNHHHQLNVRKNKTCVNLSEPHLRSIAASSDRYSAYEQALSRQGLAIQPIEGDGNCLFRSVSHQVCLGRGGGEGGVVVIGIVLMSRF